MPKVLVTPCCETLISEMTMSRRYSCREGYGQYPSTQWWRWNETESCPAGDAVVFMGKDSMGRSQGYTCIRLGIEVHVVPGGIAHALGAFGFESKLSI